MRGFIAALAVALSVGSASAMPASVPGRDSVPSPTYKCALNEVKSTCTTFTIPGEAGAFGVMFNHADRPFWIFRPDPTQEPTTDGRRYIDEQGRTWRLFGHRSTHLYTINDGIVNEIWIEVP